MSEWPRHYILVGRTPIAVDMMTWAQWFGTTDRHIDITDITDRCYVSTVFLGLEHNYRMSGEPILFETLIFGGPLDGEMWRYHTYADAERGHAEAVKQVKAACMQVKAIADAAGVTEK